MNFRFFFLKKKQMFIFLIYNNILNEQFKTKIKFKQERRFMDSFIFFFFRENIHSIIFKYRSNDQMFMYKDNLIN
jgi:hypothetical protein